MAPSWREHWRKPGKPKRVFQTLEAAEQFARQNKVTAYECSYCGAYHVGGNNHGGKA